MKAEEYISEKNSGGRCSNIGPCGTHRKEEEEEVTEWPVILTMEGESNFV